MMETVLAIAVNLPWLSFRQAQRNQEANDKKGVSAFLKQAEEIFATAGAAGAEGTELAVLVDHAGCIQVLAAGGWSAEALRVDRGARTVYRISRSAGRVRLEGRTAEQRCLLESARAPVSFKSSQ